MSSPIPFTTFEGFLKSISLDDLDEFQRKVMKFAAHRFFLEPTANEAGTAAARRFYRTHGTTAAGEEAPCMYRRFSGGPDLPRGRYYTLSAPTGDDGGTLSREIAAYIRPKVSGETYVFDPLDSYCNITELCAANAVKTIPHLSLVWLFYSRGRANPIFERVVGHERASAEPLAVFCPYRLQAVSIPRIIDLRLPNVQAWLTTALNNGIEGVLYEYAVRDGWALTKQLRLADPPASPSGTASIQEDLTRTDAFVYPACPEWNGVRERLSDNFHGLLPILMSRIPGGNPITNVIGRWLRTLGCNALIYPSARSDAYAEIIHGKLRDSHGWVFVDYRAAPAPSKNHSWIIEPHSWSFLTGRIEVEVSTSRFFGSFQVHGPEAAVYKWLREEAQAFYSGETGSKS
jgi:hypothetical protein